MIEGATWIPVGHGEHVLVDDDDVDKALTFSWALNDKGYAVATYRESGKKRHVRLHRLVLDFPRGMQVDHVDGNRRDNRKRNLRVASHGENLRNRGGHKRNGVKTSRYKGVHFSRERRRWVAGIGVDGRRVPLGRFTCEVQAARAYDEAARKHHGSFAFLNFPHEDERGAAAT
jgi:hypothetical protein